LEERMTEPTQVDGLHGLLALQSADGSFGWDGAAEALLRQWGQGDASRQAVESRLFPLAAGFSRERVVQTVLVLLLLADRYADREPLWRRAYRKASRQFLAKAFGKSPSGVEEWMKQLREAL
jgi:hypothetical protein